MRAKSLHSSGACCAHLRPAVDAVPPTDGDEVYDSSAQGGLRGGAVPGPGAAAPAARGGFGARVALKATHGVQMARP